MSGDIVLATKSRTRAPSYSDGARNRHRKELNDRTVLRT